MDKEIYLPKHVLPQAKHYAEIHCELNGIKKSNPKYKDEYEKAFYNFCEEAYTHSLTPSGEMGQNPSAHIEKKYYEKTTAFIADVAKQNKKKKFSAQDVTNMQRRYRMAITTLTHLFLELKEGMQIKTRDGKLSAFQYPQDSKPKDRVEVQISQYMRLFVATVMTAQNDTLFRQGEFSLDKLKGKQLFYGVDFDKDDTGTIARKLHRTEIRKKFVENVYNAYKKGDLELDRSKTPKLNLVTQTQLDKAVKASEPKVKPAKKVVVKKEKDAPKPTPKKTAKVSKPKKEKPKTTKVGKEAKKTTVKKEASTGKTSINKIKSKLDRMIKDEMVAIRKKIQFETDKNETKQLMKALGVSDYKQIETIIKNTSHPSYKKLYDKAYARIYYGRLDGTPRHEDMFEIEEVLREANDFTKPNPHRRTILRKRSK